MRYVLALLTLILLLSTGCNSPRPYTAVSAPLPSAEGIPLWQTAGPLRVGVAPYLEPERQRLVFDEDFRARGILPLLVVVHNQGTEPIHLQRGALSLTLPDSTERHPLPVATGIGTSPVRSSQGGTSGEITDSGDPHKLATAAWLTTMMAAGVAAQRAEETQRRAWAARGADYEAKMLANTIVDPGARIHGFVFFTSPAARGFEDATLNLRMETRTSPDVVMQVPLKHLGQAEQASSK